MLARLFLSASITLSLASTVSAEKINGELIERIREGHRASRETIQSLHVKYDYKPLDAVGTVHSSVEYWQQGEMSLLKQSPLAGFTPRLEGDSEVSVNGPLDSYSSGDQFARLRPPTKWDGDPPPGEPADGRPSVVLFEPPGVNNPFNDRSPWSRAGIYFSDVPIITLDELLTEEGHVKSIEPAIWDGHQVLRIEIERDHTILSRGTFYVDPALNYLVRKLEIGCDYPDHTTPYGSHYHIEAKDFVEAKPGVYFPRHSIGRWFNTFPDGRPEELILNNQTDFTLVEINEPIDPALLEFKIPPNANVIDHRTKVKYVVDENSKLIGEPVSIDTVEDVNQWMFEWPFRVFIISILLVLGSWYLWRVRARRAAE